MGYLKDLTIDGVKNDIFFPYVATTRSDTASADTTAYTTPSITLPKGLYLFVGRVLMPAGSSTSNFRTEATLQRNNALYARLFRLTASQNNVTHDYNYCMRMELTEESTVNINVTCTVSKKILVDWTCIKLS